MYDLIIIGGGPAGITAAIYAARKRLDFAIIYKDIGGEIAKTTYIENYTGYKNVTGEDLTKIFEEHLKMFNPKMIEDQVLSIEKNGKFFKILTREKIIETKTILISTGAMPKKLNIPGEKEFASKGVSWCATCDAPIFAGKDVAVIGAGNTGLTSVLQLLDIADNVYLINKNPEIKADKIMVEKAKKSPRFKIYNNSLTKSISGKKFVESMTFIQEEKEVTLHVDGVFINIGYSPNTSFLQDLVDMNKFGEIMIDEKNMTSCPGIFAAGDVTNIPYKQIIIAAGDGANAAIAIYDYLAKLDHANE